MALQITVCADDYGMTAGVSRGILEVAHARRINAASAMTNMPDWPRAAAAWRAAMPPAALGLHLNLTLGAPKAAMLRLAPHGSLPTIGTLARARELPGREIAEEIARQLDAFVEHAGCPPAHIDGHQHVHILPAVRDALFAVLRDRGWHGLPLRNSADRVWRILRRRIAVAKALGVATLGRDFATSAQQAGFSCNDSFAGFSSFDPRAVPTQFARALLAPGVIPLLMCHPGYVDDALRSLDPVTDARDAERAFLMSPAWPALLERAGLALRPVESRAP